MSWLSFNLNFFLEISFAIFWFSEVKQNPLDAKSLNLKLLRLSSIVKKCPLVALIWAFSFKWVALGRDISPFLGCRLTKLEMGGERWRGGREERTIYPRTKDERATNEFDPPREMLNWIIFPFCSSEIDDVSSRRIGFSHQSCHVTSRRPMGAQSARARAFRWRTGQFESQPVAKSC